MIVRNVENVFSKDDLYYCYSSKLKKFLCKTKGISFIGKGVNEITHKSYWLFLRNDELSLCLTEWTNNAENGIKAID